MSPHKMFASAVDRIYLHLVLEDWTELPAEGSPEWREAVSFFRKASQAWGGRISEMRHNGVDVHLLTQLFREVAADAFVEALRRQLHHPYWRPFEEHERFDWLGRYRIESVRQGDTLAEESLERPTRRYKREHFSKRLDRELPPWHEAPTPESVGVEFVAAVGSLPGSCDASLYLYYRKPADNPDALPAAQMNARLRVGPHMLLVDSIGWAYGTEMSSLVFEVPIRLLSDPHELPETVEVWWETDERKCVASVPCFSHGTEPAFITARA